MEPNESNKYKELDFATNVISNKNDIQILEAEEVSCSEKLLQGCSISWNLTLEAKDQTRLLKKKSTFTCQPDLRKLRQFQSLLQQCIQYEHCRNRKERNRFLRL